METKKTLTLLGYLFYTMFAWCQEKQNSEHKIVITLEVPTPNQYWSNVPELQLRTLQHNRFLYPVKNQHVQQQLKSGYVQWEFATTEPQLILPGLFSSRMAYTMEPGDEIHIRYFNNKLMFSGSKAKSFQVMKIVESILVDSFHRYPSGLSDPKKSPASSIKDYLAWNNYLNEKTKSWLKLLDSSKQDISKLVYLTYKGVLLTAIEKIRMHKFHSLRRSTIVGPVNQFGLSNEDLCRIYDTTMNNKSSKWLRFERDFIFDPDYIWEMLHDQDYRRRGKFFRVNETDTAVLGQESSDEFVSLYNLIKENHTGIVRENLMAFTFCDPRGALRQVGFTPKVEAILADYYAQAGYPASKKRVKEYEVQQREKWNMTYAPTFSLTDAKGKRFSSQQLKGKIGVLDFWFTGCTGCVQMVPALRKVEERFVVDTNIVFLSVSIDKNREQWAKSILQQKYTTGGGIQLYTDGEGDKHDLITRLFIESYPTLEIIGPDGAFVMFDNKKIDPRHDNGDAMIAFLQKQLAEAKDGPYVFYNTEEAISHTISGTYLSEKRFDKQNTVPLTVQTDQGGVFNISLKTSLYEEPAEFEKADKLFVLSDIEGNFDVFRKLLQSNKVIDDSLNWTFGTGHLVFGGDMFDRGRQVTECLWLIYSLEEKAKAAGGYVHFILGNHEIMNLQGDHTYVQSKYKTNAAIMGKTLLQLYDEQSELGRWLRTKNIVEKIGNILFLHGGVSRKLNNTALSIAGINELARPLFATNKEDYGDERINSIMRGSTSPFWYRAYYGNKKEMPQIIDSTLQKFNVDRIVTGHTIVADTISVHYDHKVINTDTHHAEGKSEALLIEGGTYYRTNIKGERIFLFSEPSKPIIKPID